MGRHLTEIDELEPSAEPRDNVLHAGQEDVPIDSAVGTALVVGETYLVGVRGMLLFPAPHEMRHRFGSCRKPNCESMQIRLQEASANQAPKYLTSADVADIVPCCAFVGLRESSASNSTNAWPQATGGPSICKHVSKAGQNGDARLSVCVWPRE